MSAWMERNDCMSNSESFGDRRANGPYPCVVPTTAIAHTTQMTAEVSRGPKRNAAQMRNGVQRNVQGSFLTSECSSGENTTLEVRTVVTKRMVVGPLLHSEVSSVETKSAAASANRGFDHFQLRLVHHRSRNGVKTSAPAASPSHQVRQMMAY